ncbi:putative toxin-antitoxin system toxin component, PIN family [Candidatus Manganitrophus noduliformans]|uniref:Putative toxin-antitoxin system toxin component, PIN family n=1 Tax=Candidatus Manganitrophus noduliformans TaxID=2606439 RepID=A0A7X6DN58_9BACT|nr:putative toxin-antitoxin system toxin component, PIN family [Candidatus Manganitrophus noduliformans]NKE70192.1 putative toxin-antitoxin system toxin component, PIN family [Candidatus Manganitrophus noduliformans]
MEGRRWRVFLDTSALIAGIISTTGAARELLRLSEAGIIETLLSRQVLTEADRNLSEKLPALISDFHLLVRQIEPVVVEDPSRSVIAQAARVIHHKDAPILAAAVNAKADYLVTWNTRHFHKSSVKGAVRFKIMTPGEFLEEFRRSLPEHDV